MSCNVNRMIRINRAYVRSSLVDNPHCSHCKLVHSMLMAW